jgi:hypothetical protein
MEQAIPCTRNSSCNYHVQKDSPLKKSCDWKEYGETGANWAISGRANLWRQIVYARSGGQNRVISPKIRVFGQHAN